MTALSRMLRRCGAGAGGAAPSREEATVEGRVSVVIPLFNHAPFIAEAVASALTQGLLLRELIVVDDGSTDESAAIMRRLAAQEARIVFWSQPNRGAHAAINAGLARATGELVAILNSDDRYGEGRLAALAGALDDEPDADLAASEIGFIDADGARIPNAWYDAALAFLDVSGDPGAALINGNYLMTTSNFLFRRRLPEEVGGFAPLRYAHDLDFALRLVAAGRGMALVRRPLLHYRMHGNNTISEGHDRVKLEWAAVAAFFLTQLWDRPDSAPIDWARARALEDVLDRHALTRPVHLCMAYFRRHPTDTMQHTPFLRDASFRALLAEDIR